MFKIVWLAMLMVPTGPAPMVVEDEVTKFQTRAECEAFGESHAERAKDWVRGSASAPMQLDVQISFHCGVIGDPA